MARGTKQRRRGVLGGTVELVATVAVALGLAFLIQAFLVKPYRIPSPSMVPTLQVGQRILVWRINTHPGLGDVVVFHPPAGADNDDDPICGNSSQGTDRAAPCDQPTAQESSTTFVKRVVGLPGDHLRITDGKVYRNGVMEKVAFPQGRGDSSYKESSWQKSGSGSISSSSRTPFGSSGSRVVRSLRSPAISASTRAPWGTGSRKRGTRMILAA